MDKRKLGLYTKFTVTRNDGKDAPGEKHESCDYFVLDLTHDPHAQAAIIAYAESAKKDGYEKLAAELMKKAESWKADTDV